jgi:hypothetical protein
LSVHNKTEKERTVEQTKQKKWQNPMGLAVGKDEQGLVFLE